MDILATGLYPTPTAIDVTVINTVRASAFNASNNSVLNGLLDEAAEVKNRKYKELCAVKGWTFVPAVCDAFGAMRSNTRMLVKKIIKKVETKVEAEERPLIGRKVWGTLTTAIVSRAAKQLAQVANIDNPAGIPLAALNWRKRPRIMTTVNEPVQHGQFYYCTA